MIEGIELFQPRNIFYILLVLKTFTYIFECCFCLCAGLVSTVLRVSTECMLSAECRIFVYFTVSRSFILRSSAFLRRQRASAIM